MDLFRKGWWFAWVKRCTMWITSRLVLLCWSSLRTATGSMRRWHEFQSSSSYILSIKFAYVHNLCFVFSLLTLLHGLYFISLKTVIPVVRYSETRLYRSENSRSLADERRMYWQTRRPRAYSALRNSVVSRLRVVSAWLEHCTGLFLNPGWVRPSWRVPHTGSLWSRLCWSAINFGPVWAWPVEEPFAHHWPGPGVWNKYHMGPHNILHSAWPGKNELQHNQLHGVFKMA